MANIKKMITLMLEKTSCLSVILIQWVHLPWYHKYLYLESIVFLLFLIKNKKYGAKSRKVQCDLSQPYKFTLLYFLYVWQPKNAVIIDVIRFIVLRGSVIFIKIKNSKIVSSI